MIIMFWNFINQTIHLLNDPEAVVTCTGGNFHQLLFAVYLNKTNVRQLSPRNVCLLLMALLSDF